MSDSSLKTEQIRRQYENGELRRADLTADPHVLFANWLQQALASDLLDATAMSLATASTSGKPSVRIVLLKGTDNSGLQFYTDYESDKGRQLSANPEAAVVFHWRELNRQLRISGPIEKLSVAQSETYFASRPQASQWAASASHQSAPIDDRAQLEQLMAEQQAKGAVPMPQRWGGYHLQPVEYEFWQGRANRLHDRFHYRATTDGWVIERRQP